jgi:release factor glutamine methyltransferase
VTVKQAYEQLRYSLFELYGDREAANIADMAIEHITGLARIDRIMHKSLELNAEQAQLFQTISVELISGKPIQYVIHEAWFAGMPFYVNEHVLIPRPETEELVEWIVEESSKLKAESFILLDIGTGSGCIPIALKKKITNTTVDAIDVSANALSVALRNAKTLNATINFYELDILKENSWQQFKSYNIIVSNPPYIKQSEAESMHQNVLQHEPHLALFVPDNDALLFYRKIADFALIHLQKNGLLFFEINEALGKEVIEMLANKGFQQIELRKDLQGKDRMVKAQLTINNG